MTNEFLEVAIHAVESSGKVLVDYFEKLHDFRQKGDSSRDLVTEVDLLSERTIKDNIKKAFPNHSIIGEESGEDFKDSDYKWHIDPLDGTVNYSQGIKICAVSIALERLGKTILGVVFNPFSGELFFATEGNGSFLNGKPINVANKKSLADGLFVAAFSALSSEEKKKEYSIFGKINDLSRGALRLGSAAIALAYVACGRLDGFWAKDLFTWDVAAGLILVEEAGGRVSTSKGSPFTLGDSTMIVSNDQIHEELLKMTQNL